MKGQGYGGGGGGGYGGGGGGFGGGGVSGTSQYANQMIQHGLEGEAAAKQRSDIEQQSLDLFKAGKMSADEFAAIPRLDSRRSRGSQHLRAAAVWISLRQADR